MITYVQGNFFASPARTLVNTVNTEGIMGKGIAKVFRTACPSMFDAYKAACSDGSFDIGSLHLYRTPSKWLLNFPTKRSWRKPSLPTYIEAGLRTFADCHADLGITSVAFPQLGCGIGGLNWRREVQPVMEKHLADLPIDVLIHVYDGGDHLPAGWDEGTLKMRLGSPEVPGIAESVWQTLLTAAAETRDAAGWDVEVVEPESDSILVLTRGEVRIEMDCATLSGWVRSESRNGIAPLSSSPFSPAAEPIAALLADDAGVLPVHISRDASIWTRGLLLLPTMERARELDGSADPASTATDRSEGSKAERQVGMFGQSDAA